MHAALRRSAAHERMGASARAREDARGERWCARIGDVAARICEGAPIDLGHSSAQRRVFGAARAREALGRAAGAYGREAPQPDGVGAKVRVERTLDEDPEARAWLAAVVEQTIERCGGDATIGTVCRKLEEAGLEGRTEIGLGRVRLLAEIGEPAWSEIARSPAWAGRAACALAPRGVLEGTAARWAAWLVERAARGKIAGARAMRCTGALAGKALEWPLSQSMPPLAALWADARGAEDDTWRWAARAEVEATTARGGIGREGWGKPRAGERTGVRGADESADREAGERADGQARTRARAKRERWTGTTRRVGRASGTRGGADAARRVAERTRARSAGSAGASMGGGARRRARHAPGGMVARLPGRERVRRSERGAPRAMGDREVRGGVGGSERRAVEGARSAARTRRGAGGARSGTGAGASDARDQVQMGRHDAVNAGEHSENAGEERRKGAGGIGEEAGKHADAAGGRPMSRSTGAEEEIGTKIAKAVGDTWSASRRVALVAEMRRLVRGALDASRDERALRVDARGLSENMEETLLRAACEQGREQVVEQAGRRLAHEAVKGLYTRLEQVAGASAEAFERDAAQWVRALSRDLELRCAAKRIERARACQPVSDARGWKLSMGQLRAIGGDSTAAWAQIAGGPAWLMRATTMGLGPKGRLEDHATRAWRVARHAGRRAGINEEAKREEVARVLGTWAWDELDPPLASVWVHACLGAAIEGEEEWGAAILKPSKGTCEEWGWKVRRSAREDWRQMKEWIRKSAERWLHHEEEGTALGSARARSGRGDMKQRLGEIEQAWARNVMPEHADRAPARRLGALGEPFFKHMHPVWTVQVQHAPTALWASSAMHGHGEAPEIEKVLTLLERHPAVLLNSRRASRAWRGDIGLEAGRERMATARVEAARRALGTGAQTDAR